MCYWRSFTASPGTCTPLIVSVGAETEVGACRYPPVLPSIPLKTSSPLSTSSPSERPYDEKGIQHYRAPERGGEHVDPKHDLLQRALLGLPDLGSLDEPALDIGRGVTSLRSPCLPQRFASQQIGVILVVTVPVGRGDLPRLEVFDSPWRIVIQQWLDQSVVGQLPPSRPCPLF